MKNSLGIHPRNNPKNEICYVIVGSFLEHTNLICKIE